MNYDKFTEYLARSSYKAVQTFAFNQQIYFLKLVSIYTRTYFLINTIDQDFFTNGPDHTLLNEEHNYKNYRQRVYLEKIDSNVACVSKENLCFKNQNHYLCYKLDCVEEELSDPDECQSEDSVELDIKIDDYPIGEILPVINYKQFIDIMNECEDTLLEQYNIINKTEEMMNEQEVKELLLLFDNQKEILKETIYDSHRDAYNIRRDIEKIGNNLKRIRQLQKRSVNERDLVRFKVDRLALETEEKLDNLHLKLSECRNSSDNLLKKYRDYIDSYKNIK